MTDHPPAIPAIQVRMRRADPDRYLFTMRWDRDGCVSIDPWTETVPLGLSPEQPARLSGEP